MKQLSLLISILCLGIFMNAQPLVTIQDVQTVNPADLAACIDASPFLGDTVTLRGVVVTPGGLAQVRNGRNIWIQDGTGPFSGLDVFEDSGDPTMPQDLLFALPGDSVEITGEILSFSGETEIDPISFTLLDVGRPVGMTVLNDLSDLNDNQQINQLETGEQWEGSFVAITNVTVVAVDFFSGNTRVSIVVQDGSGNVMNVSDRFLVQRLPANGGTFVPPAPGTQYDTIKGVIVHSANGCAGGGRGYELYPFDESHYVAGTVVPPQVSNINRNPSVPTSSQDVTVSANIEDPDGTITSAELFFAVGVANNNYQSLPMSAIAGNLYSATIPSTLYSDGDFVKYYICATDDSSLTACNPDVPSGNLDPAFFTVRDNGLTIYDVQFTPFNNGNSAYQNSEVTIEGVVTSTTDSADLGSVFIQEEGQNAWGGIMLVGTGLDNLQRGDKVQATGTVREDFGFTRLEDLTNVTVTGTGTIDPVIVNPNVFSTYDFSTNEQYEGMLVTLANTSGGRMYVVDENADLPSNFAEWRVGTDVFDPNSGSRVLTGRRTGSAFGSLSVSFVNDSTWQSNSGIMLSSIPVCVVAYSDSVETMTGIMYYSFGNFKLLPRNNGDFGAYTGANCSSDSIGSVSIDEVLSELSEVVLYPNPATSELNVRYNFEQYTDAKINLINLMGQAVRTELVNGVEGTTTLSTSGLTPGAYILTIESNDGFFFRDKVLISK